MIDLVAYYAKRKDKALEDGDKRLAASYAHLEEAERIARSGKLPDRESALLSPSIAFICLRRRGETVTGVVSANSEANSSAAASNRKPCNKASSVMPCTPPSSVFPLAVLAL